MMRILNLTASLLVLALFLSACVGIGRVQSSAQGVESNSLADSWQIEIGGFSANVSPIVVSDGVLFTNEKGIQLGLIDGWIVAGEGFPLQLERFRFEESALGLDVESSMGRWKASCDPYQRQRNVIRKLCWVKQGDYLLPLERGKLVDEFETVLASWAMPIPSGPKIVVRKLHLKEVQ
jgi:hypothetical protein